MSNHRKSRFAQTFEDFREFIAGAERMAQQADELLDKIPPGVFRTETVTTAKHHVNGDKDVDSSQTVEAAKVEVLASPSMVHVLINEGFRRLKITPENARKLAARLIECADAADKMSKKET